MGYLNYSAEKALTNLSGSREPSFFIQGSNPNPGSFDYTPAQQADFDRAIATVTGGTRPEGQAMTGMGFDLSSIIAGIPFVGPMLASAVSPSGSSGQDVQSQLAQQRAQDLVAQQAALASQKQSDLLTYGGGALVIALLVGVLLKGRSGGRR